MSDNESFNKCTTDASTRVDFVAEANAKSAAALWLAYCDKKMELEAAQDRIEALEAALRKICDGPRDADKSYPELLAEVRIEARAALAGEKKDLGANG